MAGNRWYCTNFCTLHFLTILLAEGDFDRGFIKLPIA